MRIVPVIPGEEVYLFPFEGKNATCRFTVLPKRGLLTFPGVQEFAADEFRTFETALNLAKSLLGWDIPAELRLFKDGNAWCCVGDDFINLQESLAGFGETPVAALRRYGTDYNDKVGLVVFDVG